MAALAFLPVLAMLAFPSAGQAQNTPAVLKNLHTFSSAQFNGALIIGPGGNFFGVTSKGGDYGAGSVFQLTSAGGLTTIYSFHGSEGRNPLGPLLYASDGYFYGITLNGGATDQGTIYKLSADGTSLTTLYNFGAGGDGKFAVYTGGLVQAGDGKIYGTGGSSAAHRAAIFRLNPDGTLTLIYTLTDAYALFGPLVVGGDGNVYGAHDNVTDFTLSSSGASFFKLSSTDGKVTTLGSPATVPFSTGLRLAPGSDGNLYGATPAGGTYHLGSIFRIGLDGVTTTLHSFTGSDGSSPSPNLVASNDGTLIGFAAGGSNNDGIIFKSSLTGNITTLYNYSDPRPPVGTSDFVQGADGALYSTSANAIYRLTTDGMGSSLYTSPQDGPFHPRAELLAGSDGNLYGTTADGGTNGLGTIYLTTTTGLTTTLHSFGASEGTHPLSSLAEDVNGNLYGTTSAGGANGYGTIYKLATDNTLTVLHDFTAADGGTPAVGLTAGGNGNFYGTTQAGGAAGKGTVYQITPAGVFTTLHEFTGTDGSAPAAELTVGADGKLYGTASTGGANAAGAVFAITTGGAFALLHSFDAVINGYNVEGGNPRTKIVQGSDGNFYGTTSTGAANQGGTAYRISPGGILTVLRNYYQNSSTSQPATAFTKGIDGNLYGFAFQGAGNSVYRVAPDGTFSELASISGDLGGAPGLLSTPVQAADGALYSTIGGDGVNNGGNIVQIKLVVPTITSAATATAAQGNDFTYQITTVGGATSFSASGLPAGLSLNSTNGKITGQPTVSGTFNVTLGATNVNGTGTAPLTLTVTTVPLQITSSLNASGRQGSAFTYEITATNNPTSYGASGLPSGLQLNGDTISGTPTVYGTFAVGLSVANTHGSGTATLNLAIAQALPAVTSTLNPSIRQGVAFAYQITGSNNPTSYGASGLPAGLTINQATGKISGTPTVAGTFNSTITVSNSGGSGTATLKLEVKAAAPAITSSTTASGQVGVTFSYQIAATYSPTSYGASGLPTGLSINQTTGRISGAPTAVGMYNVTIAAFNAAGSGTAKLTIVVNPATPVITSDLNPPSRQGVAFLYQITATSAPTSYAATGLPGGLSVSASAGKITGKPTASGTYNVVVKAINSGGTGTATVTLIVKPPL